MREGGVGPLEVISRSRKSPPGVSATGSHHVRISMRSRGALIYCYLGPAPVSPRVTKQLSGSVGRGPL